MTDLRRRLILVVACLFLSGPACGEGSQTTAPSAASSSKESSSAHEPGENKKAPADKEEQPDVALAAEPAPAFEVETFDGGTFAIREQLGTPVVLNFWESW